MCIKNSENREKALAYIRVSSQRQADEGVSLDAQKRRILDYANFKNIPLDESDIIIEKGVSGGIPLWDRPRGRTLKRKLASGQYQHLISMKIDRLFRVTSDMLNTVDDLNDAGIDLHIVDMGGQAIGRLFLRWVSWQKSHGWDETLQCRSKLNKMNRGNSECQRRRKFTHERRRNAIHLWMG